LKFANFVNLNEFYFGVAKPITGPRFCYVTGERLVALTRWNRL